MMEYIKSLFVLEDSSFSLLPYIVTGFYLGIILSGVIKSIYDKNLVQIFEYLKSKPNHSSTIDALLDFFKHNRFKTELITKNSSILYKYITNSSLDREDSSIPPLKIPKDQWSSTIVSIPQEKEPAVELYINQHSNNNSLLFFILILTIVYFILLNIIPVL